MSALTPADLIQIAWKFYPRGPQFYEQSPRGTPEWDAFVELWQEKMKEHNQWIAFRNRLKADLPGWRVSDWIAPTWTACFRCLISPDQPRPRDGVEFIVVGCASVLAPYYFAYRSERRYTNGESSSPTHSFDLSGEASVAAKKFAQHMEHTYRFSPFPKEWEELIVPDIAMDYLPVGQVTLRDAVFTHGWYGY
jgi:hypothetical protein